jgi:CubicO group peptidase (beta-lactamase class C family)
MDLPRIDADRARRALGVLRDRIPAEHDGAQLYVSMRGETVIDEAVGEARSGVPMKPDTLTLWFSASKPLTTVAVAQLWEAGRLSLDDPVVRFVPEFGVNGKDAVTIRHCLMHTGGFRKMPPGARFLPWEESIRAVCASEAEWEPGTFAGYHPASSWVILGEVVRRIDGRRIDAYLRTEVFEPAGMTDTSLGLPPGAEDRAAHVFARNPEPQYQVDRWNTPGGFASIAPSSAGRGPAHDLGRFYECLLRGGDPLLRPQTVEALVAAHRVGRHDHTIGVPTPWGLGFVMYGMLPAGAIGGPRTYGHGGHSSSIAFADPDAGLVVAIVTNGLPGHIEHHLRCLAVCAPIYDALQGVTRWDEGDPPGAVTIGVDA